MLLHLTSPPQVLHAEESNPINAAVDALGAPQLTQLAAAVLPLSALVAMVEGAVERARAALLSKVRVCV